MITRQSGNPHSVVTALIVGGLLLVGAGGAAAEGNAPQVIHAVVLAVDPGRNLVVLHHEALETTAATNRLCRLKHRTDARLLRRGTVIEAVAETTHQPWTLDDVHVRARTALHETASLPI